MPYMGYIVRPFSHGCTTNTSVAMHGVVFRIIKFRKMYAGCFLLAPLGPGLGGATNRFERHLQSDVSGGVAVSVDE